MSNKVSLFNDIYKGVPFKDITVKEALERIKSGNNIKDIERLRTAHAENDKKKKDYIKRNSLWAVTFAGTFHAHSKDKLNKSSGLAIMDFDHVHNPEFYKKYHFDNFTHVFAAWISPSGDGVKFLVRIPFVDSDAEYKEYYNSLLKYFNNANADPATKDISRYCFESYDPNLLQREFEKTSVWLGKEKEHKPVNKTVAVKVATDDDRAKILDIAAQMIERAKDGEKHYTLLKASRLLGGYVESGAIDEQTAIETLETCIQNRSIDNFESAQRAIRSGIKFGKLDPITYDFQQPYFPEFKIEFPINVFPKMYQDLILKLEENLNYPKDYTAISILFCYSVLLGNRFQIHVKNGYQTVPICWFGIVGEPGVTKSHPIKQILKPIRDWDAESFKRYSKEVAEWNKVEDNKDPKPVFKKYLIDDFTSEALPKIIKANPNGIGIYADELASWVDNLDRYSSGNSMSKFLTIYDNGPLVIDRKTQDPDYVERVFLSIIGTIQPEVLIGLYEKYSKNGFFDRFLFTFPDSTPKPLQVHDIEIPEIEQHETLISILIERLGLLEEQVYQFENINDYVLINQWLIDKHKDSNVSGRMGNYISKLVSMIPRLAMIIESINYIVTNSETPLMISTNSMNRTFDLIKYFFTNAEKILVDFNKQKEVLSVVNGYKFQHEKVTALRGSGYKFREIGKFLGISEQTAKNYADSSKKK